MPSNNDISDNIEYKIKNAPLALSKSVHNHELGHQTTTRKYISKKQINEVARNKYQSNGSGITFQDIMVSFKVPKRKAQRTLKHFHRKKVLFTADDLVKQGISFKGFKRSSPQKYFPTEMKSKIIEDNKRNVLLDTTGLNRFQILHSSSSSSNTSSSSSSSPPSSLTSSKAQNSISPRHFISTIYRLFIHP